MPTTYYGSDGSGRKSGRPSRTDSRRNSSRARTALLVLGALVAVFVLIQFVPYGRDHTDPPVTNAFVWSSPQAQAIAERACYDCHSNETKYWWAVDVAPFSWLAQHDISSGRARLNFSEWSGTMSAQELQHALDGHMPPIQFTLLHPDAKLTAAEKQQLLDGFRQSLAAQQNTGGSGSGSSSGGGSSSGSGAGAGATAIINASCGSCHSAAPAQQYHAASAAEAQVLIDQMIQHGASISAADEQTLIKYYTR